MVHILYKKFLSLYPRTFRERLGESMEQTFNDLYKEKQQTRRGLIGFTIWTFTETAIGIVQEHILVITEIHPMKNTLTNIGPSALISFLLNLPFIIMELVNRRSFNEDFPFFLFFALWLNLFAVSVILLPIMLARRTGNHDMADPVPAQRNILLTNPWSTAMISAALILAPGIFPLLDSLGWLSSDRLFNGPNPEVTYLPGMIMSISLILFPIAAGMIAGKPIVRTLRTGGSLFAHPIHLIIVVFIASTFAIGFASFIIDQWPCFIGVPHCD